MKNGTHRGRYYYEVVTLLNGREVTVNEREIHTSLKSAKALAAKYPEVGIEIFRYDNTGVDVVWQRGEANDRDECFAEV